MSLSLSHNSVWPKHLIALLHLLCVLSIGYFQIGKPEIIFVGNLHGSDAVGKEMLLILVEYLCSNYGNEALVTRLVNSTRVHILPSMNPDGYEMVFEGKINRQRRVMYNNA